MPEKSAQPSRRLPFLILGSLLVLAIVFFSVRALTKDQVEVRVSPVTHENLVSQVSTNGKVEPTLMFQAHAPGPGVVAKVYVDVGQKVSAGQLLLRMDDGDITARVAASSAALQSAEANAADMKNGGTQAERITNSGELARAQTQTRQAQQSLETLRALQGKGAASAAEVASAEGRLQDAQNSLRTAQANNTARYSTTDKGRVQASVSDARASLDAAKDAYTHYVIRAPFAGTVYSLPVSDYDYVPGGEDLLDLADLNHMHVRAYFDEPEIGKLAVGQPVRIVWDARPNHAWHGHVQVAPTTVIAYGSRNVGECLITVDDADGELLPNTNVTVTVTYSQRFNVLSIPREALHTEGTTNFVYRVVSHRLQRTIVGVGAINLTRVEITSGLSEKDVVALNAVSNRDLSNGLEVQVVD